MKNLLNRSFKIIKRKYTELLKAGENGTKPMSADEWLLDNYYIIEQDVKSLFEELKHMPKKEIRGFKKDTYIILLAKKYLKKNDLRLNVLELISFIKKEQEKNILKIAELWVFPSAMKIAIISEIANMCKSGKSTKMGNAIKSLIFIRDINWKKRFDELSPVDAILGEDKIYPVMDQETKTIYRDAVTEISNRTKISEPKVAKAAIKCAKENKKHIGFYLIGENKDILYNNLGGKQPSEKWGHGAYFTLSLLITFTLFLLILLKTNNIIGAIISLIPIFETVITLINHLALKTVKRRRIPKIEIDKDIPDECKTLVVYPVLLANIKDCTEMAKKLEVCYLANKEKNLFFGILGDFKDGNEQETSEDKEIIKQTSEAINKLNNKYGDKFIFLHRERLYSKNQNKWMGKERKRGALSNLNAFLRGNYEFKYSFGNLAQLNNIKYVITLDSDTFLPIGAAKKLIGAMMHSLNKPVIENGIVTKGYGIIEPAISTELLSSNKSFFSKVYAGQCGTDTYSSLVSDLYMDMFGEAIFTGKGIYDVDVFNKCLSGVIPDDTVLSHDLLEGSYCRCALASDIEVYDGYPSDFLSYSSRQHRWIRGDWQIIRWIGNKVKKQNGDKIKNPISALSKWKIADNLRRSLTPTMQFLLIIFAGINRNHELTWLLLSLLSVSLPAILYFTDTIFSKKMLIFCEKTNSKIYYGAKWYIYQITLKLLFIAYSGYYAVNAAVTALCRLKSKKNTLEWVTAAEKEKGNKDSLKHYYTNMIVSPITGIAFILFSILSQNDISGVPIIFGTSFMLAPFVAYCFSKPYEKEDYEISENDKKDLLDIASRIWRFFDRYMNEGDNYLPPDNIQIQPYKGVAHRTSPTNIGLGVVAVICACELKFITRQEAVKRIEKMISTIEKLEKWQGHLYNWYNTETLQPLRPRYVSTVDSGNFVCYMLVTAAWLNEDNQELKSRIINIADKTKFKPLYDKEKELFSIGYSIDENRITNSYYDLLASEARQAGFLAVARGEAEPRHWMRLDRSLTESDGYKGLVSWTGTMFEYLMPLLIMKNYKNSMLYETYLFVIKSQKKYGKKRRVPWGVSESGYYSFDNERNYQYKAFGVPELGLKRGLTEDVVTAPYATLLALMVDTKSAMQNIKRLKKEGLYGEYGMYEAIDYSPDSSYGIKSGIVKSYMAHHQGMSLAAITNVLNKNILQTLFHSYPEIKTAEPLLKEKVPVKVILTKEHKETVTPIKQRYQNTKECVRKFSKEYALSPMHVLSNGAYSVVIDTKGNGYSLLDKVQLNKFSYFGKSQIIQIKCAEKNTLWSAYGQTCTFSPHMAEYSAENGKTETKLAVYVSPDDNAEIRRLTIMNKSSRKKTYEIFFMCELSLTIHAAQIAHNAFANLFVKTSNDGNTLFATRRKRQQNEKSFVGFALPVTESKSHAAIQFETDRNVFLGRGHDIENPRAFYDSNAVNGGVGNVLDSCFAYKVVLSIEKGESASVSFISGMADSLDNASLLAAKLKNINPMDILEDAYRTAKNKNIMLNINEGEEKSFLNALPHIIYGGCSTIERERCILQNANPVNELWKFGISGDLPIILFKISRENELGILDEMLRAHAYWRHKEVYTDLVIWCDEPIGYIKPLKEKINKRISKNKNNVYIIDSDISEQDKILLTAISKIYINAAKGGLDQITPVPCKTISKPKSKDYENNDLPFDEPKIFNNGYGGFDGDEYIIIQKKAGSTPAPWINVVANNKIGFISSESGGGYTWYLNSSQRRLTEWSNDYVSDRISEKIIITEGIDEFSPMAGAFDEEGIYKTVYGFGYTGYCRKTRNLDIKTTMFVPVNDSVKIIKVSILNLKDTERTLNVSISAEPIMGVNQFETRGKKRYFPLCNGAVGIQNAFSGDNITMFLSSSGETRHKLIDILSESAKGDIGGGFDALINVYENISVAPNEEKTLCFILGAENNKENCEALINKYKDINTVNNAFKEKKDSERQMIDVIRVNTPSDSFDIMLNGRLLYQTFECRLTARTAFYQSSGAFGFRDQLQDCLALVYSKPDIARKQILLHAAHQFEEGDVMHWWHDGEGKSDKGVRTKFVDDRLWLVYLVADYIKITGDKEILNEKVQYIHSDVLSEFEKERYLSAVVSQKYDTLYNHCIKAINSTLKFGIHDLPLIFGGDWNDGMNNIGDKGNGESVWLAWFIIDVLNKFSEFTDEETKKRFKTISEKLSIAANKAWDGLWYKRAYFDNGEPLGSAKCEECSIDSISQSWSVISGAADNDKANVAMDSVERLLVDDTYGIIKLLTPPFDRCIQDPGYIKGYLPGIRENGGQYTHAAVWVGIAFAMLKDGKRAMKIFDYLNPISHSNVHLLANIYKVEPYALAADVYSSSPHMGRGGWTWYTGAASWMYRFAVEYILGFKKKGNIVKFEPVIPDEWEGFRFEYKYIDTIYNFTVKKGKEKSGEIKLTNDGTVHEIAVII